MLLASWASQSKCCISWDERRLALKTVQHLTVLENVCFVSGLISCHVRQFPDPSKLRESLVSPQYMFPQQDLCGAHASNNNISHPPCRWIIMLGANVQVGCTSHDCLVCIIYIYMFVYILMYACVLSNFFMYAVYVYIYTYRYSWPPGRQAPVYAMSATDAKQAPKPESKEMVKPKASKPRPLVCERHFCQMPPARVQEIYSEQKTLLPWNWDIWDIEELSDGFSQIFLCLLSLEEHIG